MTNVVQMQTKPEQIAKQIHACLANMRHCETEWVENAVRLCEEVAAAKAVYPNTKQFGRWWDGQDFDMNADTRAALVAMGQDIEKAREVLAITERRSIERVYRHEFQLRRVPKSPKSDKPKSEKKQKAEKKETKIGTAAKAIIDKIDAGVISEAPAPKDIAEELNICRREAAFVADQVATALDVRAKAVVDPEALPGTWKDKYDAAKRQMEKAVRMRHDEEVHAAAYKELEERIIPLYASQFAELKRYLANKIKSRNSNFSKKEWRSLLSIAHPDTVQDETRKEKYREIFEMLKGKEEFLLRPEEDEIAAKNYPKAEDMINALRKHAQKAR
jgi:hypothetical protein